MNPQEDKLQGEILEDARIKAEHLLAKAKNDADAVIAKAKQAAQEKHQQRIQDAHDEADKQVKTTLAGIDMEILRRWLGKRETCIDQVLQEALEQAWQTTGLEHDTALKQLAKQAMQAIGDEACTVTIGPDAQQLIQPEALKDLAKELFGEQASADFTIRMDPTLKGGLIFQTLDGRKTFDNTYARRLERMKDDLRLTLVSGTAEN